MTNDAAILDRCAEQLLAAYRTRQPIEPLRNQVNSFSPADAYAIQLKQVDHWAAAGRRLIGHKVGLTSKAMQIQLGVDQPDYGHLYADMIEDEHVPIDTARYVQAKIEPEIAILLAAPLQGPGVTVQDCRRAVGAFMPALEIIDSRIRDWDLTLADTIADNASSGGLVVGVGHVPAGTDVRWTGCTLLKNGRVEASGTGAAVLDDPLRAVAWLANTVGEYGVGLEEGQIILPGSCTAAVSVQPGATFTANFGALGTVTAAFASN